MEQIELVEPQKEYAEDIWLFRQEILEYDAENESRFAGCMSLDNSESAEDWIRICNLDIDRNFRGVCEYIDLTVKNLSLTQLR